MSKAKLPLNKEAVKAANDAILKKSGRTSLTLDEADAELRRFWMDSYLANGGELEPRRPPKKNRAVEDCPLSGEVNENWQEGAESVFPGQQSYQNCGVQSSREIIEQAKGQCLSETELEFLNNAIDTCKVDKAANHPLDSGGTNAKKRKCLLKSYGIDSTVEDASVENVEKFLKDRKGVIISADVEHLWDVFGVKQTGRHAIVVTNGKYDRDGNLLGVYINDTGINKRYYVRSDRLKDILKSGSGQMNVTSNPIWPEK